MKATPAALHLRALAELELRKRRRERYVDLRPQPGPQTTAWDSTADVLIYGGAAGGGKTWLELLLCARHRENPRFAAVVFRRTSPQITNPGGLWDESTKLYPQLGADHRIDKLEWRFPSGAKVKFAHLQHEHDKLSWQGAQVPLICFDELTHFSESQFFYLWSRNRSDSGVRGRVIATTNPDADSWVARLVEWWIDQSTGLPIPERAGAIRYLARDGDRLVWGDTRDEVYEQAPNVFDPAIAQGGRLEDLIKSVAFIPSKLSDNAALMGKDPGYLASLLAQPLVERERLLGGNWKVKKTAGNVWRREWCRIVDDWPRDARVVRYWDLAATEEQPGRDPDFTAGVKVAFKDGIYWVVDVQHFRSRPLERDNRIRATAEADGVTCPVWIEQEPGSGGVSVIDRFQREVLPGYAVRGSPARAEKSVRFDPVSSASEAGNVRIVRGPWLETYCSELESLWTPKCHDDQADATSGAFAKVRDSAVPEFAAMALNVGGRTNPYRF